MKNIKEHIVRLFVESSVEEFPLAGDTVGGLKVVDDVPNMDSIDATLDDYEILQGIREISMDGWEPLHTFTSQSDNEKGRALAQEIRDNGYIKPLIVMVQDGEPYILEGNHRLYALGLLNVPSFPALVVIDKEG